MTLTHLMDKKAEDEIVLRRRRSRQQATQIVRHFDNAAQDFAFKGAAHPDDWDAIEERYLRAKERLIQHLMQ